MDYPAPTDTGTVTVLSTYKPAQVVVTAEAVVDATAATWDQIVDAGLTALDESRGRLFGYGLRGMGVPEDRAQLFTGTFTVYGNRD